MEKIFLSFCPASDVHDFNSRRPKGLNGDFDRVRLPEHENKSLNGQKWYTKEERSPKVPPAVEKLQQSMAKLDFLTKCINTWKRKHFRSFKTIKVGQSLFKTPPKVPLDVEESQQSSAKPHSCFKFKVIIPLRHFY